MRAQLALAILGPALVLAAIGCSGPETSTPSPPAETPGTVIFGVTSDLRPGVDIDRLHVVMREGDKVVRDDVIRSKGAPPLLAFPLELPFTNLPHGDAVAITLEALTSVSAKPLVTREASTQILGGKTLLFRAPIESACAVHPGGTSPATCESPETCIHGACRSSFLRPEQLEAYSPKWSKGSPDACKPANPGEPIVIVGRGQSDYLPMMELETAQVEAGPQGGYHVWVAIRLKNLHQSGSITTVTGVVPDLGLEIPPFSVIFTFDQDEGGYCKLYGLRFQLDGKADIKTMLGKVLQVKVTVTDREGSVGTGERTVTLSETTI